VVFFVGAALVEKVSVVCFPEVYSPVVTWPANFFAAAVLSVVDSQSASAGLVSDFAGRDSYLFFFCLIFRGF
jgi:hypothetical protein